MIAVIQIRGTVNVSRKVKDTLKYLRLDRKNSCVIVEENPSTKGMVQKVKDLVTWGEVNEENAKLLKSKMKEGIAHLQPPKGGFERKGIKAAYAAGGALGYRGEKINDLVKRMAW